MRQQLQQANVLQQLAGVMTALAADMRREAAGFNSMTNDDLCADLDRFSVARGTGYGLQLAMKLVSAVHPHLRGLWGSVDQTDVANSTAWLADPSGHAEAAMQLCTAALQHVSSVLTHVLPAVQQQGPHHAGQSGVLQETQCKAMGAALNLMIFHDPRVAMLQTQLHLSPHCAPYLAALLGLFASWLSRGSQHVIPTSSSSSSSAGGDRSSSSSSSSGADPTPAQLQLFKLLGLSPELITLPTHPQMRRPAAVRHLEIVLAACTGCYTAAACACAAPAPQQQGEAAQQRWRFEQQLWLLLPSVLLPCANNLLLQAAAGIPADPQQQQSEEECVVRLLEQSGRALVTNSRLRCWLGEALDLQQPSTRAWTQEMLAMVLQVPELLLLQQQAPQGQQQGQAAAAPAAAAAVSSSFLCSISSQGQIDCQAEVLALLSTLVYEGRKCCGSARTARPQPPNDNISHAVGQGEASELSPAFVPAVAERFVEVCAVLEAELRAATTAVHYGSVALSPTLIDFCLLGLLFHDDYDNADRNPLASHIGHSGPAALSLELRQFYSLLSTVQKLGRSQSATGDELCWGQQVANACCWAAAQAAVGLLHASVSDCLKAAAVATAAAEGQPTTPAALMVQQRPDLSQLPSLVIFGRCCLFWAEQLQQQMLMLLQPGPTGNLQQGELASRAQGEYSAAHVCIPGSNQGAAAAGSPWLPCRLGRLLSVVTPWLDGFESRTAAADGAAREPSGGGGAVSSSSARQLEALSAAQQDVE
jgi:hypothetical protein